MAKPHGRQNGVIPVGTQKIMGRTCPKGKVMGCNRCVFRAIGVLDSSEEKILRVKR
jgi:hypothetical protein